MARQHINISNVANDGTGDPIRTAFDKVNENFIEVYANIGGTTFIGGEVAYPTTFQSTEPSSNTASGDGWGLQVFDAAGAKVFDSGARYMRIGTVVELPANVFTLNYILANADVFGEVTFNHASVSNGFYCVNGVRSFRQDGSFVEIYSRRISDTQLKIGFLETETCPVLLSGYTTRPNHVIIGQRTL